MNIIENSRIKTLSLPLMILFFGVREKQNINQGKFLVVPECLKIAAYQCPVYTTIHEIKLAIHGVSHAINALLSEAATRGILFNNNFTFSLANMFKRITHFQEFP